MIHRTSSNSCETKYNTCLALLEKVLLRTSTIHLETDLKNVIIIWNDNGYEGSKAKKWLGSGVSKYLSRARVSLDRIFFLQEFCLLWGACIRKTIRMFLRNKTRKSGGNLMITDEYHNPQWDRSLKNIVMSLGGMSEFLSMLFVIYVI